MPDAQAPTTAADGVPADVPPDQLLCPACDYRLYGLREPRCPECGTAFTWDDVRSAARAGSDMFEHRFRTQPLRSLLRTWYRAAFWPERVWQRLRALNRPVALPLILFIALQVVVFTHGYEAVARGIEPAMNHVSRWMSGAHATPLWVFTYRMAVDFDFFPRMLAWYVFTLTFMLILGRSASYAGSYWRHVLRIYAHATAFAALCPAIWCLLEACVDASLFFRTPGAGAPFTLPFNPRAYYYLAQGIFVVAVLVTWYHLRIAYRDYLHVRYAAFAAGLVMLSGYIFADLTLTVML